jgi:3-dehydroquinate dehydratase type I
VSVLPKTFCDAQALIKKAEEALVDFVEIRLDLLEKNIRFDDLVASTNVPLIATDKARRNEADRQALLLRAAKSGFQYVDADLRSPKLQGFVAQTKAEGAKCLVSYHDQAKTPTVSELNRILEREVSSGADAYKIVTTANRIEDNLTLLGFIESAPVRKKPVCFAMGELGKTSRLLSPLFGSFFTFACLERGAETATGQMSVQELRMVYELLGFR